MVYPQKSNPGQASQINDDVANWLRAANKKVALGGLAPETRPLSQL